MGAAAPATVGRHAKTAELTNEESPLKVLDRTIRNDTVEQLIGFGLIMLFGVALVMWPSFAEFVGRFAFSYLMDLLQILRGLVF